MILVLVRVMFAPEDNHQYLVIAAGVGRNLTSGKLYFRFYQRRFFPDRSLPWGNFDESVEVGPGAHQTVAVRLLTAQWAHKVAGDSLDFVRL